MAKLSRHTSAKTTVKSSVRVATQQRTSGLSGSANSRRKCRTQPSTKLSRTLPTKAMSEERYKILPDEQVKGLFRVAYAGSEYTVQFNRQYQHGLTKRQANSLLKKLNTKRDDVIERLVQLLSRYDEIDPQGPNEQRKVVNQLSSEFRIGVKSISTALLMRAGGINAEVKI